MLARVTRGLSAIARPVPLVAAVLVLGVYSDRASGLDVSKTPPGADHAAAHALVDGTDVPIGVIEAGTTTNPGANNGIDVVTPKYHFVGRLPRDRDFNGLVPPLAALPPLATGADDHGTLVGDVCASSDAAHTGVAMDGDVFAGWVPTVNAERAAHDLYQRLSGLGLGDPDVYVFNNSWDFGNNTNAVSQDTMFFDWFVSARDAVVVFAASNNGPPFGDGTSQIGNPGDAHNVITVGAVDDQFTSRVDYSSYWLAPDGAAVLDRRGKPDIVAPGGNGNAEPPADARNIDNDAPGAAARIGLSGTSFAAPHVTGAVALLVDRGLALPGPALRNRLAHKAILLNSARKRFINPPKNGNAAVRDHAATGAQASDFDYLTAVGTLRVGATGGGGPRTRNWTPTSWSFPAPGGVFTTFRPLDDELGTGILDVDRVLVQFDAGEQEEEAPVGLIGWNRDALSSGLGADVYEIAPLIPRNAFITVTLTWDRAITETDGDGIVDNDDTYTNTGGAVASVPDFDLRIYRSGAPDVLIAESIGLGGAGTGENVEHLHVPVPQTDNYEIHVVNLSAGLTDYAVAWWTTDTATPKVPSSSAPSLAALTLLLLGAGLGFAAQRAS